jgi:glutamine synthetase
MSVSTTLSESDLNRLIEAGEIDTVIVAGADMQGRLYGKRLTTQHFKRVCQTGVGTCSVVLGWGHDHSLDPGYELMGWDNGYPDLLAKPDLSAIRHYPWSEKTAIVMADAVTPSGTPISVSPRTILTRMVERCAQQGLRPQFASELEFFLLSETPTTAHDKGYVNLTPKHRVMHPETLIRTSEDEPFLGVLRRKLEAGGVPVELVKAEYAPGQVEVNTEYAEALIAADRHVLFKTGVKELALQQGLIATFMAKWNHDFGGSSCHVHMSMLDRSGANVFGSGGSGSSAQMRHVLAGLIRFAPELFLFFAPTTNSYRRMRPGTFAPAAMTWGEDNRTVALRLVGNGPSRRIENRIPGADVNPYLAYAAMLAAGLKGLELALEPEQAAITSNAYQVQGQPPLPRSLTEATDALERSDLATEMFGADVRAHYVNFGRQSVEAQQRIVTDYERRMLLLDI